MDRKIGLIAVTCLALGLVTKIAAQEEETSRGEHFHSPSVRSNTPILDRIEAAGKNIFGILPLPSLSGPRPTASRIPRDPHPSEATPPPATGSGSSLRNPAVNIYRSAPSEGGVPEGVSPRGVGGSALTSSEPEDRNSRIPTTPNVPYTSERSEKEAGAEVSPPDENPSLESGATSGSPFGLPVHERLRVFRQSGFAGAGVGRSEPTLPLSETEKPSLIGGTSSLSKEGGVSGRTDLPRYPNSSSTPSRISSSASGRTVSEPPRSAGAGGISSRQEPTLAPPRSSVLESGSSASTGQAVASPSGSSSSGAWDRGAAQSAGGSDLLGRRTGAGSTASESVSQVNRPSLTGDRSSLRAESDNLLIARQSPILSIQTHGPRRITVGKEAPYEVVIQNSGTVAANDLVVTIELPSWAEVLAAEASIGATQLPEAGEKAGQFLWRVGRLEPRAQEKLVLRIVPRESRPFELGVRWSFTPQRSQTEIEVQEPKLAIRLEGPREIVHGQRQIYKLIMTNTGNGSAENVMISLASKGAGDQVSASHKLGTLSAGEKKVLEVELIPRSPGQLTLEVQLQGDGNAQASLSEIITVRKPELRLMLTGPTEHFVGAPAVYRLQAANPGNAPAKNVQVTLQLPEGIEQIVSTPEGRLSFDRRKVEWSFREIGPGASQELTLRCQYRAAGLARLSAKATADADLSAADSISTQVDAVADLTLSVVDPAGPTPVGEEAVYEIRIHNRGTKTATQVEVVAYFSHGIEPVAAEGGMNRIGLGQVVFSPIAAIAPGQTQVLKVKAKAERAGNHIFRAEVYCRSAGVRLVSEGTTRYFGNAVDRRPQLAQPASSDRSGTSAEQAPVRTAERPAGPTSQEPTPAPSRKN